MEKLIAAAPVVSIEEALQGQLGGVDIVLGGDPGSRSAIRIRGTSTLNASSDPLIVIDGVPYPTEISDDFNFSTATEEDLGALLNISPNDIASVEVLQDASDNIFRYLFHGLLRQMYLAEFQIDSCIREVYSLPFNIGIVLGSSFIVHLEENEKRVLPTVPCFVLITNTPLAP